jgi:hypothetical protein
MQKVIGTLCLLVSIFSSFSQNSPLVNQLSVKERRKAGSYCLMAKQSMVGTYTTKEKLLLLGS